MNPGRIKMLSKFVLVVLILAISVDVTAGSMRCARQLVKTGDTGNTLLKKCGKPVRKYNSKETFNDRGRQISGTVSNWVYERTRKRDMIVSVHKGKVVKISTE